MRSKSCQPASDSGFGRRCGGGSGGEAVPQSDVAHHSRLTKEAELAKLFTNAWRYIKFAAANHSSPLPIPQAWTTAAPVRDPIRLPACGDLPSPGLAAALPAQGHDAAGGLHVRPFQLGQSAMAGQRRPAFIHGRGHGQSYGSLRGRTDRPAGMASRRSLTTSVHRSATKVRKLLMWSGAQRTVHRSQLPIRSRTSRAGDCRAEILVVACPIACIATRTLGTANSWIFGGVGRDPSLTRHIGGT